MPRAPSTESLLLDLFPARVSDGHAWAASTILYDASVRALSPAKAVELLTSLASRIGTTLAHDTEAKLTAWVAARREGA